MTSVDYSIDHPDDPNVQRILNKDRHNGVMTQLDPLQDDWKKLGNQFCIPNHVMKAIDTNNRGKTWDCLNATVAEWLKWNFIEKVKAVKVTPNVDWLIRAVKEIDPELAKQLEKDYKVTISGLEGHSAQDKTEDHTTVKATVKTSDKGVEETDSGPQLGNKDGSPPSAPPSDEILNPYCPTFEKIADLIDDQKYMKKLSTEEKSFIDNINVILVTATPIEYRSVMGSAEPPKEVNAKFLEVILDDRSAIFIIAKCGTYKVAIIRTGEGSDNTERALDNVKKVLKAEYVIAIGICYGAKESQSDELGSKTKMGDILVAETILDTTSKRVEGSDTKPKTKEHKCSPKLYNLFKNCEIFEAPGKTVKVHCTSLVSEDTLIRSQEYKDKILASIPQAKGGEMEAVGIAKAASRSNFSWIVIKSIVDWGTEGKDGKWQKFSSVAAAKYVCYWLEKDPEWLLAE